MELLEPTLTQTPMLKLPGKLCVLLSLLLTAQGVLAGALGERGAASPSVAATQQCAALEQATGGHPTPQSCCVYQNLCPLTQAQLPTPPVVTARASKTATLLPELRVLPLTSGVFAPPLRPPIPASA